MHSYFSLFRPLQHGIAGNAHLWPAEGRGWGTFLLEKNKTSNYVFTQILMLSIKLSAFSFLLILSIVLARVYTLDKVEVCTGTTSKSEGVL